MASKTAASLALLQGAGSSSVADELASDKVAAQDAEGTEDEAVVDVDSMNTKQIDALVVEHEIEVPHTWPKMTLAKKKAWLNSQFEQVDDAVAGEAAPATEQAAEPIAADEPSTSVSVPTKAKPKGKAAKQELQQAGDDVLSDLVHEIENMKETEARLAVTTLVDETDMSMFKLGGILSVIQANNWFTPYASFHEYVEKEIGMHYRKATYLTHIYNCLAESKVPWDKVKAIGWTKLKEIAEILTLANVDKWVKIAGSQTTLQLIETVKAAKHTAAGKPALEDQTSKTITTKTFKVHEDQRKTIEAAIEKAKENSGTTFDTAALEFICLDFLGSESMSAKLKSVGIDKALEALAAAFPDTDFAIGTPD